MDSHGNVCPICSVDNQTCVHAATVNMPMKISGISMVDKQQPKKKIRVPRQRTPFGVAGYIGTADQIEVYDPAFPELTLVGGDEIASKEVMEKRPKKKKEEPSG